MDFLKKIKAFTLAEVLLSLTIIGVISSLTIPTVLSNTEKRTNAALVKKALAKLDMVTELALTESQFQPQLRCYYWANGNKSGCTTVKNPDNEDGSHGGWTTTCPTTPPTGMTPNGYYEHCVAFYNFTQENLKVVKSCEKAKDDGCAPEYKNGINTNKPKKDGESDEEYKKRMQYESAGCGNWRAETLKTRPAFVTNDGMIFMAYAKGTPIYAVDVNGKRGPNKFGYDVFFFQMKGDLGQTPAFYPGGCEFIEKGGSSTSSMITGKY